MATKIYNSATITSVDGIEIYITPLKIKYLRLFLDEFQDLKNATNDFEAMSVLTKCATVCMKQYYPQIKTIEELEDNFDLKTIYKIIDIGAGIKIDGEKNEEPVKEQAQNSGSSWENLDLAKLETEVFLLGIWKDFEELETSMSMPELTSILELKRELSFEEKKFMASLQGVDLEGGTPQENPQNKWEELKARVASRGATSNPNDIVSFQGVKAQQAGFGIGMGLDYEKVIG